MIHADRTCTLHTNIDYEPQAVADAPRSPPLAVLEELRVFVFP